MQNKLSISGKKGISNIVVAVLTILIVVVAVFLIGIIVSKVVQPHLSPAFSCYEWQLDAPLNIESICYNNESQDIEATVFRKQESSEIRSFTLKISGENKNMLWNCGETCGGCSILETNKRRTYYFKFEDINTEKIQNLNAELYFSNCKLSINKISLC